MTPAGLPGRLGDDIAAAGVSGLWLTPDEIGAVADFAGAYILVLRLAETVHIEFPRVACDRLRPGWYAYVGSARGSGGLQTRIRRHFRSEKTVHWHIDRLTVRAADLAALAVADGHECDLAGKLLGSPRFRVAAAGFGSTDCRRCESHLFFLPEPDPPG